MIIVGLMNLVYALLSLLLVFELPGLPDSVHQTMLGVASYLADGVSILCAFLGPTTLQAMAVILGAVIIVDNAFFLYSAVMWILSKIPMLNIK